MTARHSKPKARRVQSPSSLMSFLSSKPYSYLFISTLVLGIFVSLSSSNWLIIWIGLELNLYSFIPLLSLSKINQEKEARIKYFLAQALASAILLFSTLLYPFSHLRKFILISALFIKLGIAPFHFWFPPVINGISWPICWALTTIQKISPLMLTIINTKISLYPILIVIIRGIVGGIGGLFQTQIRAIFAYSSIRHIAWILAAAIVSSTLSIFYFIGYLIIVSRIIIPITYLSFKSTNYPINLTQTSQTQIIFILSILSLGGMPPLFGFFPKILVIFMLIKNGITFICFVLLIAATMNLYFYIKIFINLFFASPTTSIWKFKPNIRIKLLIATLFTSTLCMATITPIIIPYSFYALTLLY